MGRPLLISGNVQFPIFLQASHSPTSRGYSATSCLTHTVAFAPLINAFNRFLDFFPARFPIVGQKAIVDADFHRTVVSGPL